MTANSSLSALKTNLAKVYFGEPKVVDHLLVALLCSGHVLLEDVPGLGKTTLAKALAKSLSLSFKRVQCTPDLMPSDVTGGNIYQPSTQDFKFLPGPIFTHLLLVDEINRASPRTQSAFLEAMAEGTVTVDRKTAAVPQPCMGSATQNPVEFAGTFALPEAQLDRFFMKLQLGYPNAQAEKALLQQHLSNDGLTALKPVITKEALTDLQAQVQATRVEDTTQQYIISLANLSRQHKAIELGISPRASIALMHAARAKACLDGDSFVTPAHVQAIAHPVLSHRLQLRPGSNMTATKALDDLLLNTPVPNVASTQGE